MSSYLIKKDKTSGEIIYMEYDIEGYKFKPRNSKEQPFINVNSVTIYKPDMIEHLLAKKFEKKFERLSQIILKFLYQSDEESDEGDLMILLDEIARLRSVVEIKYRKYLKIDEYNEYLTKLVFLDEQVRQKLAIINYRNKLDNQIRRGRSL